MARPAASPKPLPPQLVKTKTAGLRLAAPISTAVQELHPTQPIPELPDDTLASLIQRADDVLGMVIQARREWADKIEPVLKPLRDAKTAADALKREIDQPLADYELGAKRLLAQLRGEESRRLEAAKVKQEEEQAEAQRKLEDISARELSARTQQIRDRLARQREALEEQATHEPEPVAPVQASHSTVRKIRRWRVKDRRLALMALLAGKLPADVNVEWTFKEDHTPDEIGSWPGFEMYEDTIIAGRRQA